MKTPSNVSSANFIGSCSNINIFQWNNLMEGTKKANGKKIRNIIKRELPELYDALALDFYNPYESKCVHKEGLLVYVHSSTEYFIKYKI